MKVIVVGCGRVGSALAYHLYQKGHAVTVVDQDAAAFDHLALDFQGRLIVGDVLNRNVLQQAEIESADALAVVTRSDALNALVAHLASTEYQVKQVVARNYDPRQRPLQDAFGVPVVSSAGLGVLRLEELLLGGVLHLVFVDDQLNFAIYRLTVPATWQGHHLAELLPEPRSKPLSWARAGRPLPLSSKEPLNTGDVIYLHAHQEEARLLRQRLHISREQNG